jgi:hypothetical protein
VQEHEDTLGCACRSDLAVWRWHAWNDRQGTIKETRRTTTTTDTRHPSQHDQGRMRSKPFGCTALLLSLIVRCPCSPRCKAPLTDRTGMRRPNVPRLQRSRLGRTMRCFAFASLPPPTHTVPQIVEPRGVAIPLHLKLERRYRLNDRTFDRKNHLEPSERE